MVVGYLVYWWVVGNVGERLQKGLPPGRGTGKGGQFLSLLLLFVTFVSMRMCTRSIGISNAIVTRTSGFPVVKTGVIMGNAAVNAIASVSNGFSLSIPRGSAVTVSCVNYRARRVGVAKTGALGVILGSGTVNLSSIIIVNCNSRHGSSLANNVITINRRGLRVIAAGGLVSGLTKRVPNVGIAADGTGPNRSRSLHIHNRGSLDTSGSPLVIVSNVPCDKSLNSVSPSVVRGVSMLGSTSSTTVCNSHNTGNMVLVRAGGNGGKTPAISCGKRINVRRTRRHVSVVGKTRCMGCARSCGHVGCNCSKSRLSPLMLLGPDRHTGCRGNSRLS